jgi:hypothetical protein
MYKNLADLQTYHQFLSKQRSCRYSLATLKPEVRRHNQIRLAKIAAKYSQYNRAAILQLTGQL